MNGVMPLQPAQIDLARSSAPPPPPSPQELEARERFQDFVAGTFYSQMLKSLRKLHDKPAYFHGGRAEEIFQAQLDQTVAEGLARNHGEALAGPLFDSFAQQIRLARQKAQTSQGGKPA